MEEMKLLWELQEVEYEIINKEKELQNIPSVGEYLKKKKNYSYLEENLKKKVEEHKSTKKELGRREMDLQKLTATLSELTDKLYSGEVRNVKELESMEKKTSSLTKEKNELEDKILELMEKLEVESEEIKKAQSNLENEGKKLETLKEKARRDMLQAQKELDILKRRRDEIEKKVDDELLKKYRELSKRFNRKCISLVKNNFCGICNVSLPSSFRAYLLTPGKLVYCENCGSLLVLGN